MVTAKFKFFQMLLQVHFNLLTRLVLGGHCYNTVIIRGVPETSTGGLKFRDPCSAQAQIHQLGKQLATMDNECHQITYNYSHLIIKIKSLTMCVL